MAGSSRAPPAFEDDYVTEFPELDDWDARLAVVKKRAKRALDANREAVDMGKSEKDRFGEISRAQNELTTLRTRAATSLLTQFEAKKAPPDMYQHRAELPEGSSLVQHFGTFQGFSSTMQLEWNRSNSGVPVDWDKARGFIHSLIARYQQHLDFTRAQFERFPSDMHRQLVEQLELLLGSMSRACGVKSVVPQSILKGGAPVLRPAPVHPAEGDITYDPENRTLFRADLGDGYYVSLQTVTAHRRKSHRAMTENTETAAFYNNVIAPRIAPWVEISVVAKDLTARIKVSDYFDAGTSVVYPFVAVGRGTADDFRRAEYDVTVLPSYVMQGIPSEINAMKQVCLLGGYMRQARVQEIAGYKRYSDSFAKGSIKSDLTRILSYARAYYSVENRQKGDTTVYFLQYDNVVVGVQVFCPEIRHLWYERPQNVEGRGASGGQEPTPQVFVGGGHIRFHQHEQHDRRNSGQGQQGRPGQQHHYQGQQGRPGQHHYQGQQGHPGQQHQDRRNGGQGRPNQPPKRDWNQFIDPRQGFVPPPPPPEATVLRVAPGKQELNIPDAVVLVLPDGRSVPFRLESATHGKIIYSVKDVAGWEDAVIYSWEKGWSMNYVFNKGWAKADTPSVLVDMRQCQWVDVSTGATMVFKVTTAPTVRFVRVGSSGGGDAPAPAVAPPAPAPTVVVPISVYKDDSALVPDELQVEHRGNVYTLTLAFSERDNLAYVSGNGAVSLRVVKGEWAFAPTKTDLSTPFVKQVNPRVLSDPPSGVWKKSYGLTTVLSVSIPPGVERTRVKESTASQESTATLPYQARRLASRPGADWRPSVESDLQHVMASLEEIKRALNDAQLLKEVLTA